MKIFFILLFGFMCSNHTFAKTKFSEVEKALKEDGYGKAIPKSFHILNSPKAVNPVSVSDFSIVGKNQLDLSLIMANVERNQIGMIVQMIESVQSYIITKNFGKKNVGIDFIYIFQKTIIL